MLGLEGHMCISYSGFHQNNRMLIKPLVIHTSLFNTIVTDTSRTYMQHMTVQNDSRIKLENKNIGA